MTELRNKKGYGTVFYNEKKKCYIARYKEYDYDGNLISVNAGIKMQENGG